MLHYARRVGVTAAYHNFLENYYIINLCREYSRHPNELVRIQDEREALADIGGTQPPDRISIWLRLRLGVYNEARQEFPLDFPLQRLEIGDRFEDFPNSGGGGLSSCIPDGGISPNPLRPGVGLKITPYCVEAQRGEGRFCSGEAIGGYYHAQPIWERAMPPQFELRSTQAPPWAAALPMSLEEASGLLGRLQRKRGTDRTIFADLVIDLARTRDPRPFVFDYKPVAAFLWEDQQKTQFLAALGNVVPGARPAPRAPISPSLIVDAAPAGRYGPPASGDSLGAATNVSACPEGLPADADRTRCTDQAKVFANGLYWGNDKRIHAVPYVAARSKAASEVEAPRVPPNEPSRLLPLQVDPIKP